MYNHKRHGVFKLGGRAFRFAVKPHFPAEASPEFLLVDAVNNADRLAEDKDRLLEKVGERAGQMDRRALARAVREYGGERAKKFFARLLPGVNLRHA